MYKKDIEVVQVHPYDPAQPGQGGGRDMWFVTWSIILDAFLYFVVPKRVSNRVARLRSKFG